MNSEKGIWKISTGKGNRIYINCADESRIMHPQELCGTNGLGMYGYEHLKDLAVAILMFEKEKQREESIMNEVDLLEDEALKKLRKVMIPSKPLDFDEIMNKPDPFIEYIRAQIDILDAEWGKDILPKCP